RAPLLALAGQPPRLFGRVAQLRNVVNPQAHTLPPARHRTPPGVVDELAHTRRSGEHDLLSDREHSWPPFVADSHHYRRRQAVLEMRRRPRLSHPMATRWSESA